jgi:iron complex outermembrane receptor protein
MCSSVVNTDEGFPMTRYPAKMLCAAVLASSGATPVFVHAQTTTLQLEEIIVTARKREESVQNVPVAVTALSAAELQRSSIRDMRDITAFVPNLLVDKVSALQGGAAIAIRGVSYQEIDKSLDPGVGVLLDGVYLGTNAGQILQNFDLERLEVLRGPQGTLFGRNTIGGALAIFRTAPTKELGGKVQGTLGDYGRQDLRGLLNLPMTANGGAKLWASSLNSDGYIRNTTIGDDVASENYKNGGATLAYDVTDDFDVSFTYERTDDKSDVGAWANDNKFFNEYPYPIPGDPPTPADLAGLLPLVTPGTPYTGNPVGFRDFDLGSDENHVSQNGRNNGDTTVDYVNLTMNYAMQEWYLTSITGYIDRNEHSRLEYDANSIPFLDNIGDVELTSGLYYWYSDYDTHSSTNDLFEWLAGLPDGSVGTISQHGETESYAAFTSADWSLTEKLTLNAGLRYTWEEKTLKPVGQQFFLANGTPISPDPSRPEATENWDKWSPRIGAQYQFTEALMSYLSYSEGFKSGGFFGRITLATAGSLRSFNPEEVSTTELGLKSMWWDQRLRVNAAIFNSVYSNKQEEVIVADAGGNVDTVVVNASDATMSGAELEINALLYEGLTVFLQGGYLDAEYDEFSTDVPGLPTDASGLEMRNAPKYTYGTGLNYVHPIFDHSQMSYDVTYNWRDDYVTIFDNDPLGEVDAAGFWNANIDLRYKEMLTVSVYGRNLGDERFNRSVAIPPISTFSQWNEPRNYGVTVTYEF